MLGLQYTTCYNKETVDQVLTTNKFIFISYIPYRMLLYNSVSEVAAFQFLFLKQTFFSPTWIYFFSVYTASLQQVLRFRDHFILNLFSYNVAY